MTTSKLVAVEKLPPTESFETLRAKQHQFYLFGLHISKSKAPLLINTIFRTLGINWNYKLEETDDKSTFNERFSHNNVIGSAVTMPNKIEFISEVDMTDEIGTGVGAINTVYTRKLDDKVVKIGTNTDTVGIKSSFTETAEALPYVEETKESNLPGLVYGGGGASRSAVYALFKFFGCKQVYVVNRDKQEVDLLIEAMGKSEPGVEIIHIASPEQAKESVKPKLVVLCVPNYPATTPQEIEAKETLKVFMHETKGAVLEMCYHPVIITELYKEFEAADWVVIGGVVAMIYQGFAQVMLWGGYKLEELPVDVAIKEVLEDVKKSQIN